jgi:hypothetical protein
MVHKIISIIYVLKHNIFVYVLNTIYFSQFFMTSNRRYAVTH